MSIDYESMKKLIKILNQYDINYSFGDYYSPNGSEIIVGHWLKIDAELETDEIDEEDERWNEG